MLIEYLDGIHRKNKDPPNLFYVSEVSDCPRKIFFRLKNFSREPFEPRVYRLLENGDYTHKRILANLFSLGLVVAAETRLPPNALFSGRADAVISMDGDLYVLEIKGMSPYPFERLNHKPDISHLKQVQLYMHFLGIDRGIILCENKANQELKEFVIKKDEKMISEILDEFKKLKAQIDRDILPEKPKDIEAWRCRGCPYRKACKDERR